MRTAGLIVAAGRGQRMGGEVPKQYRRLGEQTILRHTIDAFRCHPGIDILLVVIHPDDRDLYDITVAGIENPALLPVVFGGNTRAGSVLNGLNALTKSEPDAVLIHDAARPFVSGNLISQTLTALSECPGAVPVLPVVDALWRSDDGGVADTPADRNNLWRAQTPQGFRFREILSAHRTAPPDAADDVTVARIAGMQVKMVAGEEQNFKITTPADLERAREIRDGKMDIRTGNGFDVHAFEPGDHVVLCGVTIPHTKALKGHSDADVAMHAVTDAIFGALAEGDIGQWFPPSDPQWKGAASDIFLKKACERAAERGFAIANIDCTIICEHPKIGPVAGAMRTRLAQICGISEDRVSVKATTSERLGFTGRGEGIAALATTTLVKS